MTNISCQCCLTVVMRTKVAFRSFCMAIQHVCKLYNKFYMLSFNYVLLEISSGKERKNMLPTAIFPQKAESDKQLSLMLLKMNQKKSFGYRFDVQELTLSQRFTSPKMSILLNDTLGFWCVKQVTGGRYIRTMGRPWMRISHPWP